MFWSNVINKCQVGLRMMKRKVKLSEPAKMSLFTAKFSPWTTLPEWVLENEDYDFHQEIARSAFADMLHDSERNDKYYAGIKAVIEQTHRAGKEAHVLDIGTGTGLLAMMAAHCGADTIYACEAFSPISECAEQIIRDNRLADRITVIHKRSTEMTAGDGGDMPRRANILVTEVFDTELIGEGAIGTFNHAHKHLLERDCLVVPTSGTVYAQLVESSVMQRWNKLEPWGAVKPSRAITRCPGTAAVHDLQVSQIDPADFRVISPPEPVFRFDWSSSVPIPVDDSSTVTVKAVTSGTPDTVFMWWSLNMDPQGSVVLSCAPWWAHPSQPPGPDAIPWRDHWMQAVYYLPNPVAVKEGQHLTLRSDHDEFSLWFNVSADNKTDTRKTSRPVCDCMLHVTSSRTRLGMLNDPSRRAKYHHVLQQRINAQTVALSWGDTSLLGLLAATLGAEKVYHVEENVISREIIEGLIKDNNLESKVTVLKSSKIEEKIRSSVNLVIGELYFLNSLYPWDGLVRWYFMRSQCKLADCVPIGATLYALPMQFDHLHKIRAPLETISGFDMFAFDRLVKGSSALSDNAVEVQPLWEYPGICLSAPIRLHSYDLSYCYSQNPIYAMGNILPFTHEGMCHGIALWLDIHLDQDTVVSTGPQAPTTPGQRVVWDRYSRQGVYFIPDPATSFVCPENNLKYTVTFSPHSGEITCKFSIDLR